MKMIAIGLAAGIALSCIDGNVQEMNEFIQKTMVNLTPVAIKAEVGELGPFSSIARCWCRWPARTRKASHPTACRCCRSCRSSASRQAATLKHFMGVSINSR
ncbi:MAG TPA: hypothetical protein VL051_06805 [Burkholderiaceae bacterium]|nr:hypothetical protein [Burkholderiaceae bacterium]